MDPTIQRIETELRKLQGGVPEASSGLVSLLCSAVTALFWEMGTCGQHGKCLGPISPQIHTNGSQVRGRGPKLWLPLPSCLVSL